MASSWRILGVGVPSIAPGTCEREEREHRTMPPLPSRIEERARQIAEQHRAERGRGCAMRVVLAAVHGSVERVVITSCASPLQRASARDPHEPRGRAVSIVARAVARSVRIAAPRRLV